jgi:hypothetical protein
MMIFSLILWMALQTHVPIVCVGFTGAICDWTYRTQWDAKLAVDPIPENAYVWYAPFSLSEGADKPNPCPNGGRPTDNGMCIISVGGVAAIWPPIWNTPSKSSFKAVLCTNNGVEVPCKAKKAAEKRTCDTIIVPDPVHGGTKAARLKVAIPCPGAGNARAIPGAIIYRNSATKQFMVSLDDGKSFAPLEDLLAPSEKHTSEYIGIIVGQEVWVTDTHSHYKAALILLSDGQVIPCVMDSAANLRHYVSSSSVVAGQCHDTGVASPIPPAVPSGDVTKNCQYTDAHTWTCAGQLLEEIRKPAKGAEKQKPPRADEHGNIAGVACPDGGISLDGECGAQTKPTPKHCGWLVLPEGGSQRLCTDRNWTRPHLIQVEKGADGKWKEADPVDVVAVQETRHTVVAYDTLCHVAPACRTEDIQPRPIYGTVKSWTCADKNRGLWHDENDPPKWWCRKAQP